MRIAIPLDEDKAAVCPTFGRAPYFLLYDDAEGKKEMKENPAAQAPGGAGLQAAQFVVDCGAQVLITPRCGENAAEVLKEADVRIYKSEGTDAEQNLAAFRGKRLAVLEKFHSGYHGIR